MAEELHDEIRATMEMKISSDASKKRITSGIVLIPQPSNDPYDPLNWSKWKKTRTLIVISLAAFSCTASASAGQLAYVVQAPLYSRSALELSYTVLGPLPFFLELLTS